jgi:hypothetical protein
MRSTVLVVLIGFSLMSTACSLFVAFDEPSEPKCDMEPPDCSVKACLEYPACDPVDCDHRFIYYDSPPACPGTEECVWFEEQGMPSCVSGIYFSDESNFYNRCDDYGLCPHGAVCVPGMEGSPDVCIPYCNMLDHARCPEDGKCYRMDNSAMLDICFRPDGCDPVKNRGCPSGEGCYYIPTSDTTCLPAGNKVAEEWCSILWDCAGGHICSDVVVGDSGVCKKVCKVKGDCQAGEICEPVGLFGFCRNEINPM